MNLNKNNILKSTENYPQQWSEWNNKSPFKHIHIQYKYI